MATYNAESQNAARLNFDRRLSQTQPQGTSSNRNPASNLASRLPGASMAQRLGLNKNQRAQRKQPQDISEKALSTALTAAKFVAKRLAWMLMTWLFGILIWLAPWILLISLVLLIIIVIFDAGALEAARDTFVELTVKSHP
ncbi:MAG: hypothetical protein HYR90_05015 [Candidatus Andersenbacteria bacterium]|nr:hypothetical protein [Candidatus Andersenbacteria bacterium]MBI3250750.1 hypothetical protein [Candidatus Andersenbacteria bacterium]